MRCLPQNGLTARATVGPTVAFLSGEEPRLWNTTHVYMHKSALGHGGDFFGDGQRLFRARANCWTSQVIARQKKARKRSEEHTSELQSPNHLVCRPLLEKKTTQ